MLMLLSSFLNDAEGQQNFIYNYDFEIYTQCPDNLGQVDRCVGFFNLIENADYSNCNFDVTNYYPSDSGAYSGTGFMTMATHGNAVGAAETIAQNLQIPLDSGIAFDFQVMTKRADSGQFSNNCGGFYLYGFADSVAGPNWSICVASLPGAALLGFTDIVDESIWSSKSFTFTTPFKVKAIAFSPACAVNCHQVIFLDSVSISLAVVDVSEIEKNEVQIFPQPANNQLVIQYKKNTRASNIEIYNVEGKLIISTHINAKEKIIDTAVWKNGIYFIRIISGENVFNKKLIVQH